MVLHWQKVLQDYLVVSTELINKYILATVSKADIFTEGKPQHSKGQLQLSALESLNGSQFILLSQLIKQNYPI